jgi:hypothetical protein
LDKVARYRHAHLAAVPVDLNAKIDNLSLEELLASIKEEWAKLGPMLDLSPPARFSASAPPTALAHAGPPPGRLASVRQHF